MKKIILVLIGILTLYIIYIDLSIGTLPAPAAKSMPAIATESGPAYFTRKAAAGDTVLSILEQQLDRQLPVPITTAVEDFIKLNAGIKPEEIQVGKVYNFPDYTNLD